MVVCMAEIKTPQGRAPINAQEGCSVRERPPHMGWSFRIGQDLNL